MKISNFFDLQHVNGKPVYIVDDHHKVLAAWDMERRKLESAPFLLTIDHHTDTDDAFASYCCIAGYEDPSIDQDALAKKLLAAVDWRNDSSIEAAIQNLRHDEHINAATKTGILAPSFSIQLSDGGGWTEPNDEHVYVVPFHCAMWCKKKVYDDECVIHHAVEIIESPYLDDQVQRIGEITAALGLQKIESLPYILDIDLDVFHSMKAANPNDASTFHRLILGTVAITIATEAEWVGELWNDETNEPSSDQLLSVILGHIEEATSTNTVMVGAVRQ